MHTSVSGRRSKCGLQWAKSVGDFLNFSDGCVDFLLTLFFSIDIY